MQPLDDFEARFAGADFHKGMEVAFSNTRSGGLALRIAGKDVRTPASSPHSAMILYVTQKDCLALTEILAHQLIAHHQTL